VHRRALGGWLERIVFADAREPLPLALSDYPTRQVALAEHNLVASILASCSIPFVLEAVHDVPGGPPGSYWDGGITDYHLHLDYGGFGDGVVLYPHFGPHVVPGWLDKPWKRRHAATEALSRLVLLAPRDEWIAALPGGKLPDRRDFKTWGENEAGRQAVWRGAHAEAQRLADEFAEWVSRGGRPGQGVEIEPLP
jgi:hypothetical protein